MQQFTNALKAEWTKMSSLRSLWSYAIIFLLIYLLPVCFMAILDMDERVGLFTILTTGNLFLLVAVVYVGNSVAAEISQAMYAHAFLTQDRRSTWLLARATVIAGFLTACYVLGFLLALLVAQLSPHLYIDDVDTVAIFRPWVTILVYSAIALLCAVLNGSRALALGLPLAMMFIIENVITAAALRYQVLEFLQYLMPSYSLARLDTVAGVLGAIAWIVGCLALALWRNARRDLRTT